MVQADENNSLATTEHPRVIDYVAQAEARFPAFAAAPSITESSSSPSDLSLRRRSSAFVEVGLSGDDAIIDAKLSRVGAKPRLQVRFRSELEIHEPDARYTAVDEVEQPPRFAAHAASLSFPFPSMLQIFLWTLLLALALPSLQNSPFFRAGVSPIGAKAGAIRTSAELESRTLPEELVQRDNSPVNVCTRWSQQSAIVNGTLYIYGGRTKSQASQTSNTWNNDFLTLDLSKNWQISSPTLQGLPQPSGPPPVANGYLWNSLDTLYLYGGEFSDDPATSPVAYSMWSYDIASSTWNQNQNPQTSAGDNSDGGGHAVQNAAEGAGLTVPSMGRGYYFGGHLDGYTTAGWSQSIERVYLTSLLEFTFPGRSNPAVHNNQAAGASGLFRNITQGGLQDTASFPERADGVLVYVPGFGAEGIILGLAGGNNITFTQMNVIDVFDVAKSTWYKQSTSGPTPPIRVNPCAVAQSAPDGSSIQIYMYGGQNLVPAGNQTQYDDVWILTLPSFTWIHVDTSTQSVPPARAGHTCNSWNAQMIVVGGYVGTQLECDTPGIYVFNLSSLTWENSYTVLQGGNALNQQKSQEKDGNAMAGTYGYAVPAAVQKVIGGSALGGATVTAPAQTATAGPFATGSPVTYTLTGSGGAVVTQTGSPGSGPGGSGSSTNKGSGGTNVGVIVASVIAGLFAVLAAYLGFCTWVYRRQLRLYQNHVAMAQRAHLGTPGVIGAGIPAPGAKLGGPSSGQKSSFETRSGNGGAASSSASGNGSGRPGSGRTPYQPLPSNNPYASQVNGNASTANSSTEDLLADQEPSFLGVFLNPRRSLRVVNRD